MKNDLLDKSKFDFNFQKMVQSQFLIVAMCSCFLQSIINNKLLKGFYILSNYVLEGSRIQIRIDKSKFD